MKKKNRRSVWLCCSVIQANDKNKKKNHTNTTFPSSEEQKIDKPDQDVFSRIFGQNDDKPGRFKACICCSVVEDSPPSRPHTADSGFDIGMTNEPTTIVTGVPAGK